MGLGFSLLSLRAQAFQRPLRSAAVRACRISLGEVGRCEDELAATAEDQKYLQWRRGEDEEEGGGNGAQGRIPCVFL